jgi:short-subunit dehydrogenase
MSAESNGLAGRSVSVVGASSGIGAALASELIDRGARVAISARRADLLEVVNMLEALRIALAKHGISVTTVCPGFVRTELTAGNAFPMPFMIEADEAARSICNGLERGRMEIVFPLPMAVLMKFARFIPVRLWTAVMSRTTRTPAHEHRIHESQAHENQTHENLKGAR